MGNRLRETPRRRATALPKPVKLGSTWPLASIRRPLALGVAVGCVVALLSFRWSAPVPPPQRSRVAQVESPQAPPAPPPTLAVANDPLPDSLPPASADSVKLVDDALVSAEPTSDEFAIDEFVVRPAPRIELETRDMWVSNRAVAAVIVMKRTGSKQGPARVRWKTLPGTATPAKHYESKSNTVKFADGQATRTVFVPIIQQPSGSDSRTFSVILERAPSGSALGSVTSTTVTILGDS